MKAESFLSLLRFVPSAAHPWIGYLLSDQQACLLQSEIGHPLSSLPTGAVLRHTMKEAGLGLVVQLVSACLRNSSQDSGNGVRGSGVQEALLAT